MRRFFADTFYWIALLVRRDDWHERVTFNHTLQRDDTLFTTDAIILEFLVAFSSAGSYLRQQAVVRVEAMLSNPYIHVVEVPRALLEAWPCTKTAPTRNTASPIASLCR